MHIQYLLVLIFLLIIIVLQLFILLSFKRKDKIKESFDSYLSNSSFEKNIGEIKSYTNEIKSCYKNIEQILRVPKERSSFGEFSLEEILNDQLPKEMFSIRKEVFDGKRPDASIKSSAGIICIDSKFPLDNYIKYLESGSETDKNTYKKEFLKNVQNHLKKILDDYIAIEKGSCPFAFAYIPSESVYYFLQVEAFDLLLSFSRKGVQVVSPLTISQKIELIKANVYGEKLSQNAEELKNKILLISKRFSELDEQWKIFYEKHLRQALSKAEDINNSYRKIKEEFEQVAK